MASYTKVSTAVPLKQRMAVISSVAAGDQVDVTDILGRPANIVRFHMTDAGDEIELRINNRIVLHRPEDPTPKVVWMTEGGGDIYTGTGQTTLETIDGLKISSFEVVSLTLSTGSTIEVTVA